MLEVLKLFKICFDMKIFGIPIDIIILFFKGAIEFDGISDLMFMWQEEKDIEERTEILYELFESISDCYIINRAITIEEIFETGLQMERLK